MNRPVVDLDVVERAAIRLCVDPLFAHNPTRTFATAVATSVPARKEKP